jgi:hypothetical protein
VGAVTTELNSTLARARARSLTENARAGRPAASSEIDIRDPRLERSRSQRDATAVGLPA